MDFAEAIGAIEIPDGFWIGDYYNGGWHHEKPQPETQSLGQQITDEQLERIETVSYTHLQWEPWALIHSAGL